MSFIIDDCNYYLQPRYNRIFQQSANSSLNLTGIPHPARVAVNMCYLIGTLTEFCLI